MQGNQKKNRIKVVRTIKNEKFCVTCGMKVKGKINLQWHTDLSHKLLPVNQVIFEDDKSKKQEDNEQNDKQSDSKKAYDFALSQINKFAIAENDTSKVYGLVNLDNHYENLELSSLRAIQWLSHSFHKIDNFVIHTPDFFKNILQAIVSDAQMNGTTKENVYTRIAQLNNEIYYDLGTSDWKAVKITNKDITIVNLNHLTPLFTRKSSLAEQVRPKFDDQNALDKLAELLLISGNETILFKVHLISFFLQTPAIPIASADGPPGNLKTTLTSTIKRIVDPNGISRFDNYVGFPKNLDDLVALASNRYMLSFDNVSIIDQEMSDELCRIITGGGTAGRKFYTNFDETISSYKNKIVLNGIVPKLDYPDLRTRLINYQRKRIDESDRISEEVFEERFLSLLPYILGQIFLVLQTSLKIYPVVRQEIKPTTRMADFELWGEAISRSMGYEKNLFHELYERKLKEDILSAKEFYIVVDLIVELMNDKNAYENSVQTLFNDLKILAANKGLQIESKYVHFPKIANQLSKELKIIDPILSKLGFKIESYHWTSSDDRFTKNAKIIKITKSTQQDTLDNNKSDNPSSPSSLPHQINTHASSNGAIGEDFGEVLKESSSLKISSTTTKTEHGESGEQGEDKSSKLFKTYDLDPKKPYWMCFRCNQKGTQVQHISYLSPNGTTVENHLRAHRDSVKFLSKEEAKLERDSQTKGFLRISHDNE